MDQYRSRDGPHHGLHESAIIFNSNGLLMSSVTIKEMGGYDFSQLVYHHSLYSNVVNSKLHVHKIELTGFPLSPGEIGDPKE